MWQRGTEAQIQCDIRFLLPLEQDQLLVLVGDCSVHMDLM